MKLLMGSCAMERIRWQEVLKAGKWSVIFSTVEKINALGTITASYYPKVIIPVVEELRGNLLGTVNELYFK